MEKDILKFVPFSEMEESPSLRDVPRVEYLKDKGVDSENRSIKNFHTNRRGLKLLYSASDWLLRRRAATNCECCGKIFHTLAEKHGDHNHRTGEWRGVLCLGCNVTLGWVEKNPNLPQQVQTYLKLKN